MQIYGDHAVDSDGLEQTRDVGSGNGHSGVEFAVLSRVAVVRNDGSDLASGGPAEGGDHEEELHEVIVDGRTGGLDDVDILSTDVFVHSDLAFSVDKFAHLRRPQ